MFEELARVKVELFIDEHDKLLGLHWLVQTVTWLRLAATLTNSQMNSVPTPPDVIQDCELQTWKAPVFFLYRLSVLSVVVSVQTCSELGVLWYMETHECMGHSAVESKLRNWVSVIAKVL
jgi:hypothetical protein